MPVRLAPLILLLLLAAFPVEAQEIPAFSGRVTDRSGVLPAQARAEIESRLAELERKTGAQIMVLTIPTTSPDTIEQFGIRVAETWRPGRKDVEDGAILIVATGDRAVRIEAGYGLEGALTDLRSKRIIDEQILPRFRAGDVPAGILAGVEAISSVVEGEELPPPARSAARDSVPMPTVLLFGGFIFGFMLRALLNRLPAATIAAGATAAVGFLTGAGAGTLNTTLFVFVLVLAVGPGTGGGGTFSTRGSRSSRRFGDWGFGTGGGFGGGGGGGFSPGGGGFGGGGASGRW